MSTKSKMATIAALATIIAAPAYAAPPVKHMPRSAFDGAYASPFNPGGTTGPTSGRDWQLEGRLPLTTPNSGE